MKMEWPSLFFPVAHKKYAGNTCRNTKYLIMLMNINLNTVDLKYKHFFSLFTATLNVGSGSCYLILAPLS